jgi:hypothetical protein
MDGFRTLTTGDAAASKDCRFCHATGCPWDRIGGTPICPDCQERLVRGEGEPLRLVAEKSRCAVCGSAGSVSFVTVPLRAASLEVDLCPTHLRGLLRRELDRNAFRTLARQLHALGLAPGRIFLLHEAFYDRQGRALQPVREPA